VIAIEIVVAMAFVLAAAVSITGSAWLLALGFAAHGLKDAWQQRRQFVSGTGGGLHFAPPSTGSSLSSS
jgi:hypothetical protein